MCDQPPLGPSLGISHYRHINGTVDPGHRLVYSPLWSDSPEMSRRLSPSERETLQQLCMWFILMHLEELPPSYLALLPLSIRKEIISRLPIADVLPLGGNTFCRWARPKTLLEKLPITNAAVLPATAASLS